MEEHTQVRQPVTPSSGAGEGGTGPGPGGPAPRLLIGPGLDPLAQALSHVAGEVGLTAQRLASGPPAPEEGAPAVVVAGLSDSPEGWRLLEGTGPGHTVIGLFRAPASPEEVREAYRAGAADVLFAEEGPLEEQLASLLARVYGGAEAGAPAPERSGFHGLVGRSPAMVELYAMVEVIGPADATVLIRGESGTGKELVARAIHEESARGDAPFVAINCGAIPPDLLEAELFGHAKGAFTGAVTARQGRFAHAGGGTLFLDEIGEMSADLQIKLLRVLEERVYEPLGSSQSIPFEARVVAATNRDLEAAVASGQFREDLFHRLNVLGVDLPPLRERGPEDILFLFDHFLGELNQKHGTGLEGAVPLAQGFLTGYEWPGNVRELRNLTERLAVLKREGMVEPADLPEKLRGTPQPREAPEEADMADLERDILLGQSRDLRAEVEAFENRLIMQALEATAGNRNQAAQLLGVKRTTLVEKLKKRNLG